MKITFEEKGAGKHPWRVTCQLKSVSSSLSHWPRLASQVIEHCLVSLPADDNAASGIFDADRLVVTWYANTSDYETAKKRGEKAQEALSAAMERYMDFEKFMSIYYNLKGCAK